MFKCWRIFLSEFSNKNIRFRTNFRYFFSPTLMLHKPSLGSCEVANGIGSAVMTFFGCKQTDTSSIYIDEIAVYRSRNNEGSRGPVHFTGLFQPFPYNVVHFPTIRKYSFRKKSKYFYKFFLNVQFLPLRF